MRCYRFFIFLALISSDFILLDLVNIIYNLPSDNNRPRMGAGLVSLAEDILSFCCTAKRGEKFLYVTGPESDEKSGAYARAMMEAAENLGLEAMHLMPWPHSVNKRYVSPSPSTNPNIAGRTKWMWDTFKSADLIIEANVYIPGEIPMYPGAIPEYCDEFADLFETSSVRILMIMIPPSMQRALFPTPERVKRGYTAAAAIDKAKTMTVKSEAGTDLTMDKTSRPADIQVSVVDKEHRWDNIGFDLAQAVPLEDSVNGTLVLEPGDLIVALPGDPFVTDTAKLTWKDGYVTKIDGGQTAKRFRKFMDEATQGGKDKEGYGMSHFGFGISHEASLFSGSRQEVFVYHHSAAGSTILSMGRSYAFGDRTRSWKYFGFMGKNKARSHTHMSLYNLDFYLDEEKVIEKGKIIKPGF
jgi:hypothetical protein